MADRKPRVNEGTQQAVAALAASVSTANVLETVKSNLVKIGLTSEASATIAKKLTDGAADNATVLKNTEAYLTTIKVEPKLIPGIAKQICEGIATVTNAVAAVTRKFVRAVKGNDTFTVKKWTMLDGSEPGDYIESPTQNLVYAVMVKDGHPGLLTWTQLDVNFGREDGKKYDQVGHTGGFQTPTIPAEIVKGTLTLNQFVGIK